MADMNPDYRDAKELIKAHFKTEWHNLTMEWEDLLYSAYLAGIDEGFQEGRDVGYDEGKDEGESNGYDEGYDDARAEFDNEW